MRHANDGRAERRKEFEFLLKLWNLHSNPELLTSGLLYLKKSQVAVLSSFCYLKLKTIA